MTTTDTADYVGATAGELRDNTLADKLAGGVSQKAMFRRRGTIGLRPDALVLTGWADGTELRLSRADITGVRVEFTELYGRFIGGLLNAGKPLILDTAAGEIYLLIDRKEFMETTRDREWADAIRTWLAA
jgi:hypothetical protein